MSQISTYETLSTPATYLSSDDGMRSSPEAAGRHRGVWKGGLQKHSSKQMLSSKGRGSDGLSSKGSDGPHKVVKKKSNVVKRAIHKIGKKAKRSSPGPPPSAGVDTSPPKVGLVFWACCPRTSLVTFLLAADSLSRLRPFFGSRLPPPVPISDKSRRGLYVDARKRTVSQSGLDLRQSDRAKLAGTRVLGGSAGAHIFLASFLRPPPRPPRPREPSARFRSTYVHHG